jgi:Domain of unknown function (DUF4352)
MNTPTPGYPPEPPASGQSQDYRGYQPPGSWQPTYQPPPTWQPGQHAGHPAHKSPRSSRGCLYAVLGLAGVVVLIVIVAVMVGTLSGTKTGTASPAVSQGGKAGGKAVGPARIGRQVRDGKFQFTITKISHAKKVGDGFLSQRAQGEYTVLHVIVTNIGTEAQTLDDSDQYMYDSRGRKFSADSEADIYANGGSNSVFLNQINPGNTVHGEIAFDLPKGDKAVKAEVHDSMFSDGVTVSLRR